MIITGARIPARELREGDRLVEGRVSEVREDELQVCVRVGIVELRYEPSTLVELELEVPA